MKTYRTLILEDDLETVSKITGELFKLENSLKSIDFDVTVLSTYESVYKLINPQDANSYDLILLDRDCKLGGSFHILDMEKFGLDKIISISSTPQWNKEAQERGVKRVVYKEYQNLDLFSKSLGIEIEDFISKLKI